MKKQRPERGNPWYGLAMSFVGVFILMLLVLPHQIQIAIVILMIAFGILIAAGDYFVPLVRDGRTNREGETIH